MDIRVRNKLIEKDNEILSLKAELSEAQSEAQTSVRDLHNRVISLKLALSELLDLLSREEDYTPEDIANIKYNRLSNI
jgi:hypothetical protein